MSSKLNTAIAVAGIDVERVLANIEMMRADARFHGRATISAAARWHRAYLGHDARLMNGATQRIRLPELLLRGQALAVCD
jgi:hypothetical protein